MKSRRTVLVGLMSIAVTAPSLLAGSVSAMNVQRIGTLYTMSNATAENQLLAYEQLSNGQLRVSEVLSTGGKGSGGGLGNQNGLIVSPDRRWMLAVNAGSNEISVFRFNGNQPKLVNKVASGGVRPVSVTVQGNLVYVVNAGSDDVVGFKLGDRGELWQLPNSRRTLSATATAPAQIQFSPDGRTIVVTEKATNTISTFPVKYGYLGDRISTPSAANTPFGFSFDKRGNLIVSEAVGGAPNGSSVSSYKLFDNSRLRAITPAAKTNQTAACWIVLSRNGEYAYTSNTASGTITGFKVGRDGSLKSLNADGRTGVTGDGSGPIDMIISRNGNILNSLNTRNGTISSFRIVEGGALNNVATLSNIPTSANGLVVR
jgi:6-phosphogluconolactonase